MEKFLRFTTWKWKRQYVFFWRCCHGWVRGATVVVMLETASINQINIILHFLSAEVFIISFDLGLLQERVIFTLLGRLHCSCWGKLYLCGLRHLAIYSKLTIFAFFSLLTIVFLALWFVNFFLTFFKACTSYGYFHYVSYGIFSFVCYWGRKKRRSHGQRFNRGLFSKKDLN